MTTETNRARAFQRLLALEAGPDADAPAIAAAARRLCECFAHLLAPVIGDAGVAAIYDRSLRLTLQQFPMLAAGRASQQGDGPLDRVRLFVEHHEPARAADAAVAVLTSVAELLVVFVGEGLTSRLLHEAWPHEFADVAPRRLHNE